ncbi:MAG: hypothetical protein WC444_04355 [Candidatus Paceibacterota bacterium]
METPQIVTLAVAVFAAFMTLIIGVWLKKLFSSFVDSIKEKVDKSVDKESFEAFKKEIQNNVQAVLGKVGGIERECKDIDQVNRGQEKDITRLQECTRDLDSIRKQMLVIESLKSEFLEKFTRRGDFIREMQLLNSQLEIIQKKIDKLDERINRRAFKVVEE